MNTLYKSIPENKQSHDIKWRLNKWYKVDNISICNRGFHASKNIIDAMGYITCGYIAKVEVRGDSTKQNDKECWSEMRIISWKKWTKKDSVSLAIFAAKLVLRNYEKEYPDDLRPRQAIKAAKKILKNDTERNRSAESAESAESAARSAESAARSAESAARSARSAAWSAESAESAAWSAAWSAESAASAAWSAASAARSAAWSAESAESAARSAAWSAASAAWSAESAKVLKKCHDFVIKRKGL